MNGIDHDRPDGEIFGDDSPPLGVDPGLKKPFHITNESSVSMITTSAKDRNPSMMGIIREIIPFYGRTIQVSE